MALTYCYGIKNKPILTSGSKTGSQTDSSDGLAATVLPS